MKSSGSNTTADVPSRQAAAQRVDHAAVLVEREPLGLEWGTRHIAAQPLEPGAIVGADADFGVQGEMLDVATQLAWDEARTQVLWTTTQPLDRPAAVRPERDSTLDRGRAELGEERLVGLGRIGIIVLRARDPAAALEVAQDATVQNGCELDDVLIGQ